MKARPKEDQYIMAEEWDNVPVKFIKALEQWAEEAELQLAQCTATTKAIDTYARILKEIIEIPELQKSREFLEGGNTVDIISHALERHYLLGTMSEDFDIIKKDRDDKAR